MKTLIKSAALVFSAGVICGGNEAGAWGLSTDLNTAWGKAQLVFPVLQNHGVRFCIQNNKEKPFPSSGIDLQVRMGLKVWLRSINGVSQEEVRVDRVDCSDPKLNLMVEIGAEEEYKDLLAYQLPVIRGDDRYSLIKINTDYRYEIDGRRTVEIVDFASLIPGHFPSLQEVLTLVSFDHPATVRGFSREIGVAYESVFLSTYRILLHELGHSFGLCDTYESQFENACDPAFRSGAAVADQPESVMKTSNFFYLTEDDQAGIKALFQRYLNGPR